MPRLFYALSVSSLILLILLTLAWELWLAPAHPPLPVFKAVLLLLPLRGILHGRRYTYQWASMFILLFLCEGVVRGMTGHGASQWLAWGEALLSLVFFIGVIGYIRALRRVAQIRDVTQTSC